MFRRRKDDDERVLRSYATSSDVSAEPHDEWPQRDEESAAKHAYAYEQGREALTASLAATGDPMAPYPAKVFAVRRPQGGAYTYVVWTKGVVGLLAAADVVLLVEGPTDPDPVTTWVRWNVVAQVCADTCWEVQADLQPVRLLTTSWPTDEQLGELKSRALPAPG